MGCSGSGVISHSPPAPALSPPHTRYVHLAWALWERKQGNMRQCLQLLSRGQQLNPTDAAIYQAWGIVEKERGQPERARMLFEAGLRADPGHLYLWQAWGVMEYKLVRGGGASEMGRRGGRRDGIMVCGWGGGTVVGLA